SGESRVASHESRTLETRLATRDSRLTKGPPPSRRTAPVEAQGIEPWSEPASRPATTCVGPSRCRPAAVTDQPPRRQSPEISFPDSGHSGNQPGLLCRGGTPRAGPPPRWCEKRAQLSLRSHRQVRIGS